MVSLEEFSTLLEGLYAAALDAGEWDGFLTRLSCATESRLSVLLRSDARAGMIRVAQGGPGVTKGLDIDAYNERYVGDDPLREPCLRDLRPRIVQSEELLPKGELVASEMYRELLAPNDYRYGTFALCTLTTRRMEMISMWRGAAQGPMPAEKMRLLELLFPHMRRALDVRHMLGTAAQDVAAAETMADASPTPTFLLRRRGRLVHANAAGEALLAARESLGLHAGVVGPVAESSRRAFRELLRRVDGAGGRGLEVHALALPGGERKPPVQLVANRVAAGPAARTGADVLLLATDPDVAAGRVPDSVLRTLYGLTEAETEVAKGLLMGCSVKEIAELRGVATGTVRAQMKSVLAKTGTARQSELVRLLMSLPPMRAGGKGT